MDSPLEPPRSERSEDPARRATRVALLGLPLDSTLSPPIMQTYLCRILDYPLRPLEPPRFPTVNS